MYKLYNNNSYNNKEPSSRLDKFSNMPSSSNSNNSSKHNNSSSNSMNKLGSKYKQSLSRMLVNLLWSRVALTNCLYSLLLVRPLRSAQQFQAHYSYPNQEQLRTLRMGLEQA